STNFEYAGGFEFIENDGQAFTGSGQSGIQGYWDGVANIFRIKTAQTGTIREVLSIERAGNMTVLGTVSAAEAVATSEMPTLGQVQTLITASAGGDPATWSENPATENVDAGGFQVTNSAAATTGTALTTRNQVTDSLNILRDSIAELRLAIDNSAGGASLSKVLSADFAVSDVNWTVVPGLTVTLPANVRVKLTYTIYFLAETSDDGLVEINIPAGMTGRTHSDLDNTSATVNTFGVANLLAGAGTSSFNVRAATFIMSLASGAGGDVITRWRKNADNTGSDATMLELSSVVVEEF
ncbi:MAG: hypothetical protein AAGA31_14190, partial [Bacteroidota bacterium]